VRAVFGRYDELAVGKERVVLAMRVDEDTWKRPESIERCPQTLKLILPLSLTSYAYINAVGIRRVLVGCFASISAGIFLVRVADDETIEF
jgi:hypothetical protein